MGHILRRELRDCTRIVIRRFPIIGNHESSDGDHFKVRHGPQLIGCASSRRLPDCAIHPAGPPPAQHYEAIAYGETYGQVRSGLVSAIVGSISLGRARLDRSAASRAEKLGHERAGSPPHRRHLLLHGTPRWG